MSIKTGNALNIEPISAAGSVLLTAAAGTRIVVTYAAMHEQLGNVETIQLFVSESVTGTVTERIDKLTFEADEFKYVTAALIAIPGGSSLTAIGSTGNAVAVTLVYTE